MQICMDWIGKADVLEYYTDMAVHSAWETFQVPAVMRLAKYVHRASPKKRVTLSRVNILLRDRSTCQYDPHLASE
jgi:hypothetical protein